MYLPDGSLDEAWKFLFSLVETLGREGASSDESEAEDGKVGTKFGPKFCRVKERAWRAKWIDEYLVLIDSDRNVTNAYGNYRAGNRPRIRVRPARKISDSHWVPPGLPLNFYDEGWYNSLNLTQKKKLGAVAAVPIVSIQKDRYT